MCYAFQLLANNMCQQNSVGYFSGRVFLQSRPNVYQSIPLFIVSTYIVYTVLTIHESLVYLKIKPYLFEYFQIESTLYIR